MNTDASVKNGRASGGGVICDYQGRVLVAFVNELGSMGVLEAEAAALQSGLQICISRHLQGVDAEVDSRALHQLVSSSATPK